MTRHPLPRASRKQTTMRLRRDLLDSLDDLAKEQGITRSHLVERALLDSVSEAQAKKEPAE